MKQQYLFQSIFGLLLSYGWLLATPLRAFAPARPHVHQPHTNGQSSSPPSSSSSTGTSTTTVLFHNKKKKRSSGSGGGGGGFAAFRTGAPTSFPFTGTVRPGQQSPQRVVVQDDIVKPDYWQTGVPVSGAKKSLLPWMIEVKTAYEIEKMRAAGRLARHILDLAGRLVAPGVTTDEIDAAVHAEIVKVR